MSPDKPTVITLTPVDANNRTPGSSATLLQALGIGGFPGDKLRATNVGGDVEVVCNSPEVVERVRNAVRGDFGNLVFISEESQGE